MSRNMFSFTSLLSPERTKHNDGHYIHSYNGYIVNVYCPLVGDTRHGTLTSGPTLCGCGKEVY